MLNGMRITKLRNTYVYSITIAFGLCLSPCGHAGGCLDKLGKAINRTAIDAGKTGEKAVQDTGKTAEKAAQDIGHTTEKAAQDTGKTLEKAAQDTGREFGRAGKNVNYAAIAAGHFLESQPQMIGATLSAAEKSALEGRMVDAIWHVATDPIKHENDNLAKAVADSSVLNSIATAAATVYGGPAGAAAYAAWLTYKQTGSLRLALKAGIIAGTTAEALSLANGMPDKGFANGARKVLTTASIGGAAVAASGGNGRDINETFLKGAAISVAGQVYKSQTKTSIEGRAPTGDAVAKLDESVKKRFSILTDSKGRPILDDQGRTQVEIASMPKSISHVGLATANAHAPFFSPYETSTFMQGIAKIPYMNDMAYFHDQWTAIAGIKGIAIPATILPAIVLTAAGTPVPVLEKTQQVNASGAKRQ